MLSKCAKNECFTTFDDSENVHTFHYGISQYIFPKNFLSFSPISKIRILLNIKSNRPARNVECFDKTFVTKNISIGRICNCKSAIINQRIL